MGQRIDEGLDIVFICDDKYVMPTVVAITSLFLNKNTETKYTVHVLCNLVSRDNLSILEKLGETFDTVNVKDVSAYSEYSTLKIEKLHVSPTALIKFDIANILEKCDRVLYLDSDILVCKDLTSLFEADISDVYAAVVKDMKPLTYKPSQLQKLKINHSAYFNSGVMLLNLRKFRSDDMQRKLLEYRRTGINYFMDQDALNVVFKENVIYLSFFYNVLSSVIGYFSKKDICDYYQLENCDENDDLYHHAVIVHLCTKYKPWEFSDVPYSSEWYFYYEKTPYDIPLKRELLSECSRDIKEFSKFFPSDQDAPQKSSSLPEINISLTSYPARINTVHKTIQTLLNQTTPADRIMLWLATTQFPGKEKDLPEELVSLKSSKTFDIYWCEDLRPHKKYFFAMQNFPDSVIITADDDVYYPETLVETLVNSYITFPYAVSAIRAHRMTFDKSGKVKPYAQWERSIKMVGVPSLRFCATGVGGVLYPPRIMHKELFNKEMIYNTCLDADDLWLKIMQIMANVPVVVASEDSTLNFVDGTQESALWRSNDRDGGNDRQLHCILNMYNNYYSEKDTLLRRIAVNEESRATWITDNSVGSLNAKLKRLEKTNRMQRAEMANVRNSLSFRLGHFLTFVPRKLRGGLRCYREHGLNYTLRRIKEKLSRIL